MEFKIKTSEELRDSMINWIRGATTKLKTFRIGTVIVSLIEAVAVVTEELYYTIFQKLKDAIETAIYDSFDFARQTAQKATGYAVFSRATLATQNYPIPIGTLISTVGDMLSADVQFETIEEGVLLSGTNSITIKIRAVVAGVKGNVVEHKITTLVSRPTGIETVDNTTPTSAGKDEETLSELRARFTQFIASKSRGTLGALEYAAVTYGGAAESQAVDSPDLVILLDKNGDVQDVSIEATNPFLDPVNMFIAPAIVNQNFYVGSSIKYKFLYLELFQVAVGTGDIVWEYYNGAWVTLPLTRDNTNELKATGTVEFDIPDDWKPTVVSDSWNFWLRCRVVNASYTTLPLLNFIFASPPPGYTDIFVVDSNGEASPTLLQDTYNVMKDYRGAGISINVCPGIKKLVDVNVVVMLNPGYVPEVIKPKLQAWVETYINAIGLGETMPYDDLYQQMRSIEQGYAINRIISLTPTSDIIPIPGQILKPGTITVGVVK